MNTISQIHDEAMARLQLAGQVLKKGQMAAYKTMLNEALALEKEAAYSLVNDYDCEPTRSVLFRSAAAIALNAANYDDAVILATQGLSGNPFTEIKIELENLLFQAKSHVTEQLSVLHDDGEIYNEKSSSVILSTSATAKHSAYDSPEELVSDEITDQKETISVFFAKTKATYANFLKKRGFGDFLGKERISHMIRVFLTLKQPLINAEIGKEDTRWIWYSKEYLEAIYEEINYLNGNGLRIYLGRFEEDHPEYAQQTCLIWIPTRQNEHSGYKYSDDVIIEDLPDFPERLSLSGNYAKKKLPPSYLTKETANHRISNYQHFMHSLLSEATGSPETLSNWYSKEYIEYIIKAINYFGASGIRIYFGCYANDYPREEPKAEDPAHNQTCLLLILTRKGDTADVHHNIIFEKDENFTTTAEANTRNTEAYEQRRFDYLRYEPPYNSSGKKFPF
jgi:hypothetical protein